MGRDRRPGASAESDPVALHGTVVSRRSTKGGDDPVISERRPEHLIDVDRPTWDRRHGNVDRMAKRGHPSSGSSRSVSTRSSLGLAPAIDHLTVWRWSGTAGTLTLPLGTCSTTITPQCPSTATARARLPDVPAGRDVRRHGLNSTAEIHPPQARGGDAARGGYRRAAGGPAAVHAHPTLDHALRRRRPGPLRRHHQADSLQHGSDRCFPALQPLGERDAPDFGLRPSSATWRRRRHPPAARQGARSDA